MMEPLLATLPSVYAMGNHEKESRNGKEKLAVPTKQPQFALAPMARLSCPAQIATTRASMPTCTASATESEGTRQEPAATLRLKLPEPRLRWPAAIGAQAA